MPLTAYISVLFYCGFSVILIDMVDKQLPYLLLLYVLQPIVLKEMSFVSILCKVLKM